MIDYSRLWTLLSEYDISKTEFMNQIGVSSATMAKLSNNQPVTMDILERICSNLRCSLDSVVSFSDGPDIQRQWRGIHEEETYLVFFYFIHDSNEEKDVKFLYGYSCPFYMTKEGLGNWNLSWYKRFDHILQISGYSTGEDLLKMLKQLERNQPFGQMIEQNGIKIACTGCKEDLKDKIFLLSLFQGVPQYRPAYILEPRDRNRYMINAFRPQVAIGNCSMRCESLVCGNPEELYYIDQKPDVTKIMELNAFLKTIFSAASVNDMARLGCFEMLSYLNGTSNEESGIHWEIKKHEERKTGRTLADSLEIVLDHRVFSGCYAMLVRVCNTQNRFLDHLELVNCNENDYACNVSLNESPGTVEIRLYKMSGNSSESNLVADSSASLIRNISLNMHMVERRFRLEDSWTEMMRKNGKKIDPTAEYASQESVHIGNQGSEVWFENERIVREECGQILNLNSGGSLGIFFEPGDDMHMRFLEWLKQTLANISCKRVVIIDPYIDGDAIGKILRGITNPSLTYDIYTAYDSVKKGGEKKNRVEEIKEVLEQLRVVAPSSLNVYALTGDELHDRFLILEGDGSSETKVYSMSNSLDNMGQHHSSIVVPLDQSLAWKVNRFYIDLIKNNKNKIVEVFSVSKPETSTTVDHKQGEVIHSVEEYKVLCENNLVDALSQLAYLSHGELKNKCKKVLANIDGFADKMKLILDNYCASAPDIPLGQNNVQHQNYEERRLLGIGQNLLKDMEWNLNLMDSAHSIYENYAEYLPSHEHWYLQNAVKYFCRFETEESVVYLSTLRQEMKEKQPNIKLRKYKLAAMLTIRLIELLQYDEKREQVAKLMLASNIPLLHAIVIVKSFSEISVSDKECIGDITKALDSLCQRLSFKDQLISHIYVIQKLQIYYCRNRTCYEMTQLIIDEIIAKVVSIIKNASLKEADNEGISNDDLYSLLHSLYLRNAEDICKTYKLLVECAYMKPGKASEYLQKMLLEPFEKGMKNEKDVFYHIHNLYGSIRILSYMNAIDPSSIKGLFNQIKKKERMVTSVLYSATLKEQNYSLWKCYMDMFGCFVYLELWAEQHYQHKPSRAVAEFGAISSNYGNILKRHSEIYQQLIKDYAIYF